MNLRFSLALALWGIGFSACQSQKPVTETESPEEVQLSVEQNQMIDYGKLIENKEIALSNFRASRERKFDLLHTSLDLKFDWEKQLVNGQALLQLKPYFYSQKILELDAKNFDIHELSLVYAASEQPLGMRYNGQVLKVYLPHEFSANDTVRLKINYTAHPNKNSGEGSEAIKDNKGLYFINPEGKEGKPKQIWTQGETEHNSKWFPTIDTPNERATHDIKLTVEERYTTISNGELINQTLNADGTRTDHWEMNLPHAPYLVALAVGEFVKVEDEWRGKSVNYYVEEKFKGGAASTFGNTPEMMSFYSQLLGVEFPWQKYDQIVVRDFVSGAMENTTASIFMEELNMNAREAIDNEYEGIIAHELFHQWFGNYVTTESWSNLPLNEAFANYGEYLWYEHKEGRDAADLHHIGEMETYFYEASSKQVDLIRYEYEDNEDMFDSHSYAKGGRVLHMLRECLGDKAFFEGLEYYLTENAFSSVEIHDLRLAMEKVSGRDLNWFFNQWFLDSGHPELEIEVDYSVPENILLTIRQVQDIKETPLYKLPFKVSWYDGGERIEKEFVLERQTQQFALENEVPLDLVLFDEYKTLLSKNYTKRTQAQFVSQFDKSISGVGRYEALDSLSDLELLEDELLWVLERGLADTYWPIREVALTRLVNEKTPQDVLQKVRVLAAEDPNNNVRAAAIEKLGMLGDESSRNSFLEWMEDSSYYVSSAALTAYLESEEEGVGKGIVAASFEQEDNIRFLVPLIDYYSRESIGGKGVWLHEKFEATNGKSLYYLIGFYSDYFVRMPEEGSDRAKSNLLSLAEDHSERYVRLAAFQALFGFVDDPGMQEKLKAVYLKEKDLETKKAEEYFLLPYLDKN
ncbi:M1 family metallopeptidase [Echinicola marina]|uniref:M1 family aminopeptidase n=1 Tax=Echinicola marina TaxID=2859768 RepID=UPI001CF60FE8|nr:M1 family aminopeptidase [Echinicola marina]UCS93702.1 M1 family metallopeptidase [Echinicola marina]